MNRNAKLSIIIGVVAVVGVGALLFKLFTGHIEDTNGSLTNLETINLEQRIIEGSYSSIYFNNGFVQTDNYIEYSFGKLSGVGELEYFVCEGGENISIDVSVTLVEGNLRIALVDPNGDIIDYANVSGDRTININGCSAGTYWFVFGAESAKFSIRFE